ncbi:cellulose biosynthesis cyclic di-GMP-binding regulatory protein BcsB [Desulfosporosinus sp. FKA]|uniref:cellulose biosynthesis cyclic di-GMP-binding regulatory protein BcsB n=1 Tax=Desulfosporosinus sp. FKA TaxID=1969834 RepID=UPI001556BE72|nr:cellulose biosynthesis cyclic di-GMP-binding regulatory protein BcsB [Desulfosporosinus sp. FKA]
MRKFIAFVLALLYLGQLLLPGRVIAAVTNNTPATSSTVVLFTEDQNFNLPTNSVSYWFNLPKGADIADCNVNLHISFSTTLLANHSNVSVLINNSPVDTKWINELNAPKTTWWKVSIPPAMLKENALNELKIESKQRSILGDCADIDNSSNWMVIHKDSTMGFTINEYADAVLSNALPIFGDNFLNKTAISANYILPKTVNQDTLSSLLKLSSSLGRNYNDKANLNYNVLSGNITGNNPPGNRIFLGPLQEWSSNPQLTLPAHKLSAADGFLSIRSQTTAGTTPTPHSSNLFNLLVTGDNQDSITKAVDFLARKPLMDQIKSNSLTVSSNTKLDRTPFELKKDGLYKFSDFGYSSINLAGAFHQKTYLTFVQPQGIQGAKGSYLNIKFNHSKILVSDRSLMTVYINGTAVNSAKLSAANAEDGTLKVTIPDDALTSPVINVAIDCYNYLGVVDCSKNYDDTAWTVINPDSEICLLPGKTLLEPDLNSFPYFYTQEDVGTPQVALSLPTSWNRSILETTSLLASRAGQSSNTTMDWNILGPNDSLTSNQKKMDIIYLGSYRTINLPQAIKSNLFVTPTGNGTFSIKDGLGIEPETLQNKLLVQVIRSPWDSAKRLYVIMYDNDKDLNIFKKILSDGDLRAKMTGEIAVIDPDYEIHNFNYTKNNSVNNSDNRFIDRIQALEDFTHLPWWGLLALFIGLIFGLIAFGIYIYRVTKKGPKNNSN